jgi:hypothetical protein
MARPKYGELLKYTLQVFFQLLTINYVLPSDT